MRTLFVSLSLVALTGCAISDEDWARGLRGAAPAPGYSQPIQRTEIVCVQMRGGVTTCH